MLNKHKLHTEICVGRGMEGYNKETISEQNLEL